jgi:hypothetical protein
VYFSPKPSTNGSTGTVKNKPKKRPIDEVKDDDDTELTSPLDGLVSLPSEATKTSTAPMTRRSINTRSVPNNVAEQEEEKLRR